MAPLVWTIYLVVIGGGIFPAFRHFFPIVVVLAAATVHSGAEALSVFSSHHRRIWTASALTILALWYAVAQASGAEYRRALESSWVWAGHGVSLMLRDAFAGRNPLLAVTAAGCIPYWTELPCIDMLGLNDPHIARNRPADLGQGRVGHEHGDGAYVLSRKPDIIQPCGPWGGIEPCYRAVSEMAASGELERLYVPVKLTRPQGWRASNVHTTVWLRREDSAVGIRTSAGSTSIPAYLLRTDDGRTTLALVAESGPVLVPTRVNYRWTLDHVPPPSEPGPWSATLRPSLNAEVIITPVVDELGTTRLNLRVETLEEGLLEEIVIHSTGRDGGASPDDSDALDRAPL
jgi:hypothetical protein